MRSTFWYRFIIIFAVLMGGLVGFATLTPAAHADADPITSRYHTIVYRVSSGERYVAYIASDLYSDEGGDLLLQDLTTGETRVLYESDTLGNNLSLYIATNERWLYFVDGEAFDLTLYRIPLTGGAPQVLLTNLGSVFFNPAPFLTISPNGRYVVVPSLMKGGTRNLNVLDTENGGVVVIAGSGNGTYINEIGFTPDSTTLLYAYSDGNSIRLQRIPAAGGTPTILYTTTHPYISNILSPDGTFVYTAVSANENGSQVQIYRIPVSGGAALPIGPVYATVRMLSFSPNGQYGFFFARGGTGTSTLYRLTLADNTLTPLYTSSRDLPVYGTLLIAPSGTRVVVIEGQAYTNAPRPIYSIDYAAPAPAVFLTEHYYEMPLVQVSPTATISPDGQYLLFTEPGDPLYILSRIALDGSTPVERLTGSDITAFQEVPEGDGLMLSRGVITEYGTWYRSLDYFDLAEGTSRTIYTPLAEETTTRLSAGYPLTGHRLIFYKISGEVQLYLADTQPAARFTVRERGSVAEGAARTLTVEMMPPATDTMTVTYSVISGTATLGDDMVLSPAALVFAPGQTTQTLTVTALVDSSHEPLERFTLALGGVETADPATTTVSIASDVVPISDAPIRVDATNPRLAVTTTRDGNTILYAQTTPDGEALFRYDLPNRTGTRLALADLRQDIAPLLTPDEQTVLFVTSTELRRVALSGEAAASLLTLNGCTPDVRLTPDNRYALVRLDCGQSPELDRLVRIDLTSNAVITLATAPAGSRLPFADIDTHGRIAYVLLRGTQGEVYQRLIDGSSTAQVGTLTMDSRFIALAPQGNVLFYTKDTNLYRWLFGSNNPQLLADDANSTIVMVPSGAYLLYTFVDSCEDFSCYANYLVETGGTGVSYFNGTNEPMDWRFSPDGKTVVYGNSYTTAQRVMPHGAGTTLFYSTLDFLPGNHRLYAYTYDYESAPALQSIDLQGGAVETLFTDPSPTPITLHTVTANDVVYFSDSDGYLYAVGTFAPPVAFTTSTSLAAEGETASVTVSLESTPLHPVTVDYALTGGTATAGQDFTFTAGTLTFAPFERTKTFTVEVTDDGVAEGVETAVFTLSNIEGGSAGETTTYTLNIADEVYEQQLPILQR